MRIIDTPLPGVALVETAPVSDTRGTFFRAFCARELAPVIGYRKIVQINHSRTQAKGAVRGMHYQKPPHAEMKLVRCLKGAVWDVAVDLRRESSTFLKWHAVTLTPNNAHMFVIPEGCAHGFQVLEEDSELLYLHTEFYMKEVEGGALYNDPALGIMWPLPVTDLSQRDRSHPLLTQDFNGLAV